ncbi:MAG: amidophosphoribosyltransferase [Halobacteriovoraceae bacterium]|jgi:amidophosphoribosyltransferase|nr:amidophosphoribosyltransferase [Halobacteriovoraceae bacterium]
MCGIVGIIGSPFAAKESYLGLLMLQHRGQDSAGILSYDSNNNTFNSEKNLGHIKEAISEEQIESLTGSCAIAHTRYSTIGKIRKEEAQPMLTNYPYGIGMAHNGNIVNVEEVKKDLLKKNKRMVLSKNDLEVMMNILAKELSNDDEFLSSEIINQAVAKIYETIEGAYSTVTILAGHGLLAFKDPNGFRPLCWGKRKLTDEEKGINQNGQEYTYAIASESKSLQFLGYESVEELKEGELIYITFEGVVHKFQHKKTPATPCMFEWIYFANADSKIWNKNVYQMRLKFGELLGKKLKSENIDVDIVVPVPDTSRPSAITISEQLAKPYREVLIKNRYAQRTFILNSQMEREKAVHLKMNVVAEEIKDKNLLIVDDSIVRGTTSKKIIQMLRANGAKSITMVSTCPPLIKPCFFGIDFPNEEELVAANKTNREIADLIGADHVFFLDQNDLKLAFNDLKTCMACLDGKYPIDVSAAQKMIDSRIKK